MDVIKAVGMNVGKRYLMIAIVMMIVLLSAFLLFACSDLDEGGDSDPLLLNEYPLTEEDASHVGGSRIGKDTADATPSGDASQPADSTGLSTAFPLCFSSSATPSPELSAEDCQKKI